MGVFLGLTSFAVATVAVMFLISLVMGRNTAGECWIGLGAAYMLAGFITRFVPDSWSAWTRLPRRGSVGIQLAIGSAMVFCGLVYHFTQNIVVVGAAYVLVVWFGMLGYFRLDALLHREEIEAYKRERALREQGRREQQVRSRIEYRLRR